MTKLLIFYDYFDPAFKAGGPIRSLVNLVRYLEDQFDIYLITTNQDHDGTVLTVTPDKWLNYGKRSKINYKSPSQRSYKTIRRLIEEVQPDVVYINGMFSLFSVVYPLKAANKLNIPVVIAPRGMLQQTSLSLKPIKKKIYLAFLNTLLLNEQIKWQVTTEQELSDFRKLYPKFRNVQLVGNVPSFENGNSIGSRTLNSSVTLGTIALISPMKNIHLILKTLQKVDQPVSYRLYGPVKDEPYWSECQSLIEELPEYISFEYKGEIKPNMAKEVVKSFDYYIQPSKSENFGHSIFEAFNQGVPVIISDQTPWKGLREKKAGWDVSLDGDGLSMAIKEAIKIDNSQYQELRLGARKVAEDYMLTSNLRNKYRKLFIS